MSNFNALVVLLSVVLLVQDMTPAFVKTGGVIWDTYTESFDFLAMSPISQQWKSASLGKCILETSIRHPGASTIMFKEDSQTCVAGLWLRITRTPQSHPAGTHLYSMSPIVCVEEEGFSFQNSATQYMCAYISTESVTYASAKQACEDRNARLITPKDIGTFEVLQIVIEAIQQNVWVALERDQVTGSFHWAEGEVFLEGTDLWNVTWDAASEQPGSLEGGELCAFIHRESLTLHDESCTIKLPYICDKN